jgi:hypothetical protein
MLLVLLELIIVVIYAVLIADFMIGMFHWFKDTYCDPLTPIIGSRLIWGSRLHHVKPQYILEFSDTEIFIGSAKWTLIWYLPYVLLFGFSLFNVVLFLALSMNDVVHKYTHMKKTNIPSLVKTLQKYQVIQSCEEHRLHHIDPHEINYCTITPYVNVWVEKISLWRRLENLIESYLHVKPREQSYEAVDNDDYPSGIRFERVK